MTPNGIYDLDLPKAEREVLIYLYKCSNNRPDCWPGLDDMAKKLKLNRHTIINSIKSLEQKGTIKISRSPRKVNHYRIL